MGNGTASADNPTPVAVTGLSSGVVSIGVGAGHACALTDAGHVYCWGRGDEGELGDGTTTHAQTTPVEVKDIAGTGFLSGVSAISSGGYQNCALLNDGSVDCWGQNYWGALANGNTTDSPLPVETLPAGSGVTAMAGAGGTMCVLLVDTTVKCWGLNDEGGLGVGSLSGPETCNGRPCSKSPVAVKDVGGTGTLSGVVGLTGGAYHLCALLNTGGVDCWGWNAYGQLGQGSDSGPETCSVSSLSNNDASKACSSTPVAVKGVGGTGTLSGVSAIAAGGFHVCALLTAGGVNCWGANVSLAFPLPQGGQLGDGITGATRSESAAPVEVLKVTSGILGLAAGGYHSCAVTDVGGIKCWGSDSHGQLGDGNSGSNATSAAPVDVTGVSLTELSAGGSDCAVVGGGIKCWGENGSGQLGDGSTTDSPTPLDVTGLETGVHEVDAGGEHQCALTNAGAVKCWGENGDGELGNNSTTDATAPVAVSGLSSGVAELTAGQDANCALTTGGAVKCWGDNDNGQLGNATTTDSGTPVDVSGLSSGIAEVVAGQDDACALTSTNTVKCWGDNDNGQLGNATTTDSGTPVDVTGLSNVVDLAAGGDHTCALTTGATVKCWGDNDNGQLGDGTTTDSSVPVDVASLTNVVDITASQDDTCALTTSGAVKCWGDDSLGQLGNGGSAADSSTPVTVAGMASNVAEIDAGGNQTCALTLGGDVQCWGDAAGVSHAEPRSGSSFHGPYTASSPAAIGWNSPDGAGSLTTPTQLVAPGATGMVTFTYTTAAGGLTNGAVTLTVPTGWSAPSTTKTAPGYTTSSAGVVSVAGRTITVSGLNLNPGDTLTLRYGANSAAVAPSSPGAQTWNATGRSTIRGAAAALGSSPQIGVSAAPAITSAATTTFTVGSAGTFTVTTTGYPAPALTKTGTLPGGVTLTDNGNGTATLAGTPAAGTAGTYPLSLKAANGVGSDATQSFSLVVVAPPAITSAATTTFTSGAAGTFTVTASGAPTPTLTKTGTLPAGVTFTDNGNGTATLAGTPAAGTAGTYPLSLKAANGVGSDATQSFSLVIAAPADSGGSGGGGSGDSGGSGGGSGDGGGGTGGPGGGGTGAGPPAQSPPQVTTGGSTSAKQRRRAIVVDTGIRVSCPAGGAACSVALVALGPKPARATVGTATIAIPAGGAREIAFRLTPRGVKLLRRQGRLKIKVSLVSRAGTGSPVTTTRAFTVRAP